MSEQQHTTSISDQPGHPLEVEWNTYIAHKRAKDGTFPASEEHTVTLVIPGRHFLSGEESHRTRLIDLSPRTALNLLHWLEDERDTLERMVREHV